jgi:hypothetical protein
LGFSGNHDRMAKTQVMSRCSVCQERVYVGAGSPAPDHKTEDGKGQCPGVGRPTQ